MQNNMARMGNQMAAEGNQGSPSAFATLANEAGAGAGAGVMNRQGWCLNNFCIYRERLVIDCVPVIELVTSTPRLAEDWWCEPLLTHWFGLNLHREQHEGVQKTPMKIGELTEVADADA